MGKLGKIFKEKVTEFSSSFLLAKFFVRQKQSNFSPILAKWL